MGDVEGQMPHFKFGLKPVVKLVAGPSSSFKVNPKGARPNLLRVEEAGVHG
jgi:hypothetical protein